MNMPLIAAHRGSSAGTIPCNTPAAFEAALKRGADIIELDVARSREGTLFVFHPGQEPHHLLISRYIRDMSDDEVRTLRYVSMDHNPTEFGISLFDDVLEQLKNRCIINVDKFPDWMAEITHTIRRHGMQDQVIVKTHPTEALIRQVEEIAPDLPYMVFVKNEDTVSEHLLRRNVRYLGTEALFYSDDVPMAQPEYARRMHKLGLKVWVNAFGTHAAGHNDDLSITQNPDEGWGRLIDLGADMIQTDWVDLLRDYMRFDYHKKAKVW